LTIDGVGEETTTAIWLGNGSTLVPVATTAWPQSLGLFYAAMTAFTGFEVLEGESKLMGLAAFGKPRYREQLEQVLKLNETGEFELDLAYFDRFTDTELGFGRRLEALLGERRDPRAVWDLTTKRDRHYADVAASVQSLTEEAVLGLARRARRETGARDLCLAGGIALNAVANARLAKESGFERIFVQPAAGDAGGALGAAILGSMAMGDPRPSAMVSVALGLPASASEALDLCRHLGLSACCLPDPAEGVATLLSQGKIVAFVQGRFEFGPRALGQRSILASPESVAIRERINSAVKQREPFRPFAPAVLAEYCSSYFDAEPNDMTAFMTTVASVRSSVPTPIDAVLHCDGTARVQTVTPDATTGLDAVLQARQRRGEAPILLNTSLNGRAEPMVGGAVNALLFFLAHRVDALIVEDVLVERQP